MEYLQKRRIAYVSALHVHSLHRNAAPLKLSSCPYLLCSDLFILTDLLYRKHGFGGFLKSCTTIGQ